MLMNAAREIACHANVQNAVGAVGQEVNVPSPHAPSCRTWMAGTSPAMTTHGKRSTQRKTPGSFLPGVSLETVVRRSGSEVALNANVDRQRALVVEGPGLGGLRTTRGEDRATHEVLVQHGVERFRRERQVLDGGPA